MEYKKIHKATWPATSNDYHNITDGTVPHTHYFPVQQEGLKVSQLLIKLKQYGLTSRRSFTFEITEAYLKSSRISKVERFAKIVNN